MPQKGSNSTQANTFHMVCTQCGARSEVHTLVGDLVTTKEAAELLHVSPWTISAWLTQGKLRRIKAGSRTLLAKSDLEDFLRKTE